MGLRGSPVCRLVIAHIETSPADAASVDRPDARPKERECHTQNPHHDAVASICGQRESMPQRIEGDEPCRDRRPKTYEQKNSERGRESIECNSCHR